ncbi:hypothetical protein P3S68_014535 [Capsicum galapagoense]
MAIHLSISLKMQSISCVWLFYGKHESNYIREEQEPQVLVLKVFQHVNFVWICCKVMDFGVFDYSPLEEKCRPLEAFQILGQQCNVCCQERYAFLDTSIKFFPISEHDHYLNLKIYAITMKYI